MYLHIGKDMVVPREEIVIIIGMGVEHQNNSLKEFLQIAEIEGALVTVVSDEEPKSCIITTKKTYLSAISAATLMKRVSSFAFNTSTEG